MTKTRAQSSNSPDGDADRASAPILPPRITSTSHAALVKWRKERREYEDTIRNRAKGETDDLIVPIKNTFDEGLLRQWCRLRWKMSMSDVTDETILTEVDKIISTVKNNSVPDIDQEMAEHLHMDLSESDVHERVIQYFKLCHEIIDDHGWRIFFTGDDGRKQLCSILIKSLEPKALREEVDRTARFQTRKAREDEVVLHDLILEKALDHEKAYQSQRRAKRDRDRGDRDAERPAMRTGIKKTTKKQRLAGETSGSGPRPSPKSPADRPKPPPTPCPHCGDLHWLSECSKATDSIDVDQQLEQLAEREADDGEDPVDDDDGAPVSSSPPTDADLHQAVERLVRMALQHGFLRHLEEQLRAIAIKHDIWRIELGNDPPARVKPLKIRLKDGVSAVKSKPRRYPPAVRVFLREFNQKLVDLGWVYENPTSRWASPALSVRQPGTTDDEYRQTCDYRLVNDLIEALISTMPHMSALLEHTKGKKHFGLFDLLKGFWQLPLDELSQELMSYITDAKIYTPRRVPQGCCDAAVHFQQTMEQCFESLLYKYLIVWIDDLLLFADDIDTYLLKLEQFFDLVASFGLKLSAKKSSLYQQSVKWCGRIITCDGISHDPERIDALRSMPYPATADQLQQFICAANWMRESIADYAQAVDPLQRQLDDALRNSKRTKRVAAGISVDLTAAEKGAYDHVKNLLAGSATLSLPDDASTTCVFTDASDTGYSVILTQVKDFDPKVPITTQKHQLLTCLSGTFHGTQLNWTVIEKEAYPIVVACEKLDYLLLRARPFRLFCDHRNLMHVFAPHMSIKKHIRGKLLRWALKLMTYRYIIEHVDGAANVWADMLSRWAGRPTTTVKLKRFSQRKGKKQRSSTKPPGQRALRPLDSDGFMWPTLDEFRTSQQQHQAPAGAVRDKDSVLRVDPRIWVPRACKDLTQRLCVIAHCGAQGHRGEQAMVNHLRRVFHTPDLRSVVHTFVSACMLCPHVKGGKMIRRPWSETIECNERNGILHWDFLSLGESFGDSKYLLVLKDHATHFCELVVCDAADSAVATAAILDWHSRFGAPPMWVSDNGSHFKNEVVAELSRRLKSQQNFTLAYSPWINGSVERVNRDILQVLRAMTLEYKVSTKDWAYLVPLIQASLNHTALPSLGNRAPVELFTGLPCPSPLAEFYHPGDHKLVTLPHNSAEMDRYLAELRASLCTMHQPIADQRLKQRLLNKKKERGENVVNFDVGDYVLRSRVDKKKGNKLLVTWQGPYKVIRADAHSFRIRHLATGDEYDVHASRLKFYADNKLNVTEEILEYVASQGIILAINGFKKHRWNTSINDYEVLVSWKGLESVEDSWEPLKSLAHEVKVLLGQYIQKQDAKLRKYWKNLQ